MVPTQNWELPLLSLSLHLHTLTPTQLTKGGHLDSPQIQLEIFTLDESTESMITFWYCFSFWVSTVFQLCGVTSQWGSRHFKFYSFICRNVVSPIPQHPSHLASIKMFSVSMRIFVCLFIYFGFFNSNISGIIWYLSLSDIFHLAKYYPVQPCCCKW